MAMGQRKVDEFELSKDGYSPRGAGLMRRRTKTRTAVSCTLVVLAAYLLLAYFLVPEMWILHDASKVADFGDMVTRTEQDIRGDPVNVGLVGSKEEIVRAFTKAG